MIASASDRRYHQGQRESAISSIALLIAPRERDLGGFSVRRVLPYAKRRMVGPFILLDHMGPAQFEAGQGMDVRPHPHIGLATLTYLFSGELYHRDSLGTAQEILPGEVNWMTAGAGIVHSERTGTAQRAAGQRMHGLQSWIALPREQEECAPEFFHYGAQQLPVFTHGEAAITLIAGEAYGHASMVRCYSPICYLEVRLPAHAHLVLPDHLRERALYVVSGRLRIGDDIIEPFSMPVFEPDQRIAVEALAPTHFVIIAGDPLSEPRYIDWNFVSSSPERITQAREDWRARRFAPVPGDDQEFIPLPE